MLVDSKGSMKPLDNPRDTQFLFHTWRRLPVWNFSTRGTVNGLPSMEFRSSSFAASSARNLLLNTRPLPTRCCNGMHQRQPESCAIERVYGGAASVSSVCTAAALSHGNQCDQSS